MQLAQHEFEHAQDRLVRGEVGRDHVAGQCVGRLAQAWRQRIADQLAGVGQAFIFFQQADGRLGCDLQPLQAEIVEGRKGLDQRGHDADLAVGDGAVGGGNQNHRANQSLLGVQSGAGEHDRFLVRGHVREPSAFPRCSK